MWKSLEIEQWECTTICIDLPGHGDSIELLPNDDPSIEKMAELVMETLRFLQVKTFHVIGHSMGGYIGLSIKKRYTECEKLVLLNSTYREDTKEKKRDRLRMAELIFESKILILSQSIPRLFYNRSPKDPFVKNLIAEALEISPEAIAYASIAMLKRPDKFKVIEENKNKSLIVTGKFDPIIPTAILKEDANTYGLQLVELPNSGHMSHVEDTEKLKEVLHEFIFSGNP